MKHLKRILPLLLVVVLIIGIFPTGVLASGNASEEITDADMVIEEMASMVLEAPPLAETEGQPITLEEDTVTEQEAPPPADEPDPDTEDTIMPPPQEDVTEGEGAASTEEPITEPADEAVPDPNEAPVQEPPPEETVEPEPIPEETAEPEPTPEEKPIHPRNILPDPIPGYDPSDPNNPYPYGQPVDNFFPPEFDEDDPYGIMPIAQGSIPDSMWDNAILRALAYTGFNVQKLKDNNRLYKYEYISGSLATNDSSVLSNIGYGEYPNGDETVNKSGTATGKAPNIAYFEQNGLVCASFVSYFINNYLPNIEGVDTSTVYNAVKNQGNSMRVVSTWVSALNSLSTNPANGVTKYTSASTAYANLVPGDIIGFQNDKDEWMHIAIYAGTYNLYRTSGADLGTYHFIIHMRSLLAAAANTLVN